jgi:hypothetical protein
MPDGPTPYKDDEWYPPGETQSFDELSSPQAFDAGIGSSGNRRWEILEQWQLDEGARIRATLAWDGCALSNDGEAPSAVAVDLDLFLFSETYGYVWASQSLDDNNEGFDYTIPAGEGDTYSLMMAWPDGSATCEEAETEPAVYAWRIWP